MTTAKEYLGQIRLFDIRIRDLKAEYEGLLSLTGCDYSNEKVQTSTRGDTVGDIVCKREEIAQELNRIVLLRNERLKLFDDLVDVLQYRVLYERYVHNKKIIDIADNLGYCERHIHAMHSKGLKELDKILIMKNEKTPLKNKIA
nr:MAG TPA: Protein of unknown function (DUF1492) [Caudoviricetes sp.]